MSPLSNLLEDPSSTFIIQQSSGNFAGGSPNTSSGTSISARRVQCGLPSLLTPDKLKHAQVGLRAARITLQLLRFCALHGVYWTVENPTASQLWSWPPLQSFLHRSHAARADLHMCHYSATYQKPTSVVGNLPGLLELARTCEGGHAHEHLQGTVRVNMPDGQSCTKWKTALAVLLHPLARSSMGSHRRALGALRREPLAPRSSRC